MEAGLGLTWVDKVVGGLVRLVCWGIGVDS